MFSCSGTEGAAKEAWWPRDGDIGSAKPAIDTHPAIHQMWALGEDRKTKTSEHTQFAFLFSCSHSVLKLPLETLKKTLRRNIPASISTWLFHQPHKISEAALELR